VTRARELALPAYLLLCILIGGSSQGIWGNALLQLLAIALLAWAALVLDPPALPVAGRRLLLVMLAALLWIGVQLVPLPPALWTSLPGREFVARGYELLGISAPWLPISLSPYDTITTALTLLPPIALLVALMRLRSWRSDWMLASVLAGAVISIVLGALQVSSHPDPTWYFYERTNFGVAVGAFANANHFATLLLAAIPMATALALQKWRSATEQQGRSLTAVLAIASTVILGTGVLLNGSSAMLVLGPPVVLATALLALRLDQHRLRQAFIAIAVLILASAAAIAVAGKSLPGWGLAASTETRSEYWGKSMQAAQDGLLTGSGIGTFEQTYGRYEDPGLVNRWYVNHAHNDYLELLVEGGIPSLLIVLAFLLWWAGQARQAWSAPDALEQKAAAIASAAILLHSAFDYPLRTAAVGVVLTLCLALLAGARGAAGRPAVDDPRHPRHATL
jgi:O-antigen ligase